jgi:hypothetical protein
MASHADPFSHYNPAFFISSLKNRRQIGDKKSYANKHSRAYFTIYTIRLLKRCALEMALVAAGRGHSELVK